MTTGIATRRGLDLRRLSRRHLVATGALPILIGLLLTAVLLARTGLPSGAGIGRTAPDFALTDLDGNLVRLAEYRGRPVVLNFWASWCIPCLDEFPVLREARDRHAADGLAVIGVVHQDRPEAARAFMNRLDATWPSVMDPAGRLAQRYGIFGVPESFLIGPDGVVVARQIGPFTAPGLAERLAAIIDEE